MPVLSADFFDLRRGGLQPLGAARDEPDLRPSRREGMRRRAPTPADAPVITTVSGILISYS